MYYADELYRTMLDIISLPSTSGHEELVRVYLQQQLQAYGLETQVDATGNLIGSLAGNGPALLLNAHMDRVPPGLGHQPVLRDGVLYSDGHTNLGADDAAGIVIILEVLRRLLEQQLPHPTLVIVFTVQEEAGLCGAGGFDSTTWLVQDGIVFDNAFAASDVVSQGAAYESFNITLRGRTGHPGKELNETINALEIFRAIPFPLGSLANDRTRINIGRISGGSARNAIPETLHLEGEIRSFEEVQIYREIIEQACVQTAQQYGGEAQVTFKTVSTGYMISPDEPLLNTYRQVLAGRGEKLEMLPTFIGSDTSGFRPQIRVFTLSTGVMHEHSFDEYVALGPLEQIVVDMLQVLERWQTSTSIHRA